MSDPTNNSGWQDVSTSTGGTTPPSSPPPGYPPTEQAYTPPPPPPSGYAPSQAGGLSANAAAAISYLTFIPAVIFLVMDPYKRIPFVRFHAFQCIALSVLSFAVSIVLGIFFVPAFLGGIGGVAYIISRLVNLVFFVAWLACIISAAQGKWFKLPVIGDFAMKQAQS